MRKLGLLSDNKTDCLHVSFQFLPSPSLSAGTNMSTEVRSSILSNAKVKRTCLERMKKHFNKEKIVAERTLEELEKLENI